VREWDCVCSLCTCSLVPQTSKTRRLTASSSFSGAVSDSARYVRCMRDLSRVSHLPPKSLTSLVNDMRAVPTPDAPVSDLRQVCCECAVCMVQAHDALFCALFPCHCTCAHLTTTRRRSQHLPSCCVRVRGSRASSSDRCGGWCECVDSRTAYSHTP
jgi:hypothetical protein